MANFQLRKLERLVLNHVSRPSYQPVKARAIAKQLNLPKQQHSDVKKVIKSLAEKGRLRYGSDRVVLPPSQTAPGRGPVVGVFRRAAGGFGFVRPTGAASPATGQGDIYVPFRRTLDAADGDLVAVRLSRRGRRGDPRRPCGAIVQVLERDTHQFVGTYFERADAGYVQVDGTVFAQPILVGDAGAKRAQPGDKVVIEMVRFPSHLHDGEAVIVEVLGPRDAPSVDTLSVMREFRLPEHFPEEVLRAARKEAEKFDGSAGKGRRDLTDLTVITIDPEDARDFDDAISLERIENDRWHLGVHIADVAHFVQPNTPLDEEARKRGTSVYLPDRVIAMLPEIISNNLASLQPNRARYAKSVFVEFSPDGTPLGAELHTSVIKSNRRFSYEEVDRYLANPKPWKRKVGAKVFALLGRMYELAMILRRRRLEGGAIELTLPELKIELDREGRVRGARVVEHTASHQMIEEFMLAANEAVARLLCEKGLVFLRRIHERPDPRKLAELTEFVRELGIGCESLESRLEIQRVLDKVAERPERHAVNYAVLRSMKKAVYSPKEEGHYALASRAYCHFTSPIRRYPDLTIHRIFDLLAAGKLPPQDVDALALLGEHCSEREQRAEKAERELVKVKMLNFLSQKVGQQMDAVITGVEEYGLFAQGLQLPAEGLIPVQSLQDDYYQYDSSAHSLTGRRAGNVFRLGDLVRVEIAHVDVGRRELDYRLVHAVRPKGKRSESAKPASKERRPAKTRTASGKKKTKTMKRPRKSPPAK